MNDDMCISEQDYKELLEVSTQGRDLAQANQLALVEIQGDVTKVHEAIYGNGDDGLKTRVKVLEAVTGLEDSHIREIITGVKDRSIDWKTVATLGLGAMQAVALYILTSHLGGG